MEGVMDKNGIAIDYEWDFVDVGTMFLAEWVQVTTWHIEAHLLKKKGPLLSMQNILERHYTSYDTIVGVLIHQCW